MVNLKSNPILDISDVCIPLDTIALFGNTRDCALEIGFGDGDFLIENALMRPETNFIGIEIRYGVMILLALSWILSMIDVWHINFLSIL